MLLEKEGAALAEKNRMEATVQSLMQEVDPQYFHRIHQLDGRIAPNMCQTGRGIECPERHYFEARKADFDFIIRKRRTQKCPGTII